MPTVTPLPEGLLSHSSHHSPPTCDPQSPTKVLGDIFQRACTIWGGIMHAGRLSPARRSKGTMDADEVWRTTTLIAQEELIRSLITHKKVQRFSRFFFNLFPAERQLTSLTDAKLSDIESHVCEVVDNILTHLPKKYLTGELQDLSRNRALSSPDLLASLLEVAYNYSLLKATNYSHHGLDPFGFGRASRKQKDTRSLRKRAQASWQRLQDDLENRKPESKLHLNCSVRNLLCVPRELCQLPLRTATFCLNHLTTVPPEVRKWTTLKRIILAHNTPTVLSPAIGTISSLQTLEASSNGLTTLPPEISKLALLERLLVSNNKLSAVPPALSQLGKLRTLDLSLNKFTEVSTTIGECKTLQHLLLSWNMLSTITLEICSLPQLQTLWLSHNRIQHIPSQIKGLTELQQLNISSNTITTVPSAVGSLSKLWLLMLSDNPIATVSPALRNLKSLRELIMFNNNLSAPLQGFGHVTWLETRERPRVHRS